MSWGYYGFRPYVSVAERQRNAQRELAKLSKRGLVVRPVTIEGRTIASSFWGQAWCDNLESYMDYANRLPRGRTYVRNGSVVHLEVQPGRITAMVSGSELYKVDIKIVAAPKAKWKALCRSCAGGIGSLVELLQGRFSDQVMGIITRRETGLFPSPTEIDMDCSCPDSAGMCKHIAAVLYGVGARLDQSPDLLFLLRSVNHEELIAQAAAATDLTTKATSSAAEIAESELGAVFGIELDTTAPLPAKSPAPEIDELKDAPAASPKPRRSAKTAKRSTLPAPKAKRKSSVRKLSAAARARVAAAQKARWARQKLNSRRPD
jgi:uncharacterized Zn finger protein